MQRIRGSTILQQVLANVASVPHASWNSPVVLQSVELCGQREWIQNRPIEDNGRCKSWRPFCSPTYGAILYNPQFSDRIVMRNSRLSCNSRRLSSLAVSADEKTETLKYVSSVPNTTDLARLLRHYVRCYWELSKARLSMLVVTTAGAGFIMGSGTSIDHAGLLWTCLGTFSIAAAANTINQILEVGNDAKMRRTVKRPLPAGRINTQHATAWAVTTGIGGVALLASQANMLAAGLGAVNLVLYTLVYTPLKQVHPVNTWVGAVVGAVPPILGWAAAAGEVSMGSCLLASALYFWQIPHFMSVAYLCRQDYAAGGFKMLSMQDDSGRRTALVALRNCGYLLPLGFLAHQCGVTTHWFGLEAALLTAGMVATAAFFYQKPSADRARKLFRASLLYLPSLLIAMLCHRCPNEQQKQNLGDGLTTNSFDTQNVSLEIKEDIAGVHNLEDGARKLSRPPVAVFSVAPFPFLPAPNYTSS